MNETISDEPAPRSSPRARLRFSLRTMLVALSVAMLFASHLYTSYRLSRAEQEVRYLRDQAGQLTITDANRIHVLPLELQEPKAWRWRIYLPAGRRYVLHHSMNQIPKDGVGGGSTSTFKPGEYELTARVQKDERGRWAFTLYHAAGSSSSTLAPLQAQWLERPEGGFSTGGITKTVRGRETQTFPPHEPVVLLRVRASVKQPGGGWAPPDSPAQGLLVWIEPEGE